MSQRAPRGAVAAAAGGGERRERRAAAVRRRWAHVVSGLQEDTQSLFDKTGMEESNGNLPIHRDTILSEVCWDRVTITNLQ
ncbi:hypothetical protein AV530_013245 [Patagioenas fasciata monilis]|uniref:Uncharacterized protein n=1 Tax=Patagioenas fasciata monilis TaxID=372326 RepID=A0A1V4JNP1_PATFA|nr:hypothetical protein AV530_013245 [Patagioenas fasciata monilis]